MNFSDFLEMRRKAIGLQWKQVAAAQDLEGDTLRRARDTGPLVPGMKRSTKARIAKALQFNSWDELIRAFNRGEFRFGLDVRQLSPKDQTKVRELIHSMDAMLRSPADTAQRTFFAGLPPDALAMLLTRVAEHAASKLVNGRTMHVAKVDLAGLSESPKGNATAQPGTK